jgi:hypothetical protein
MKFARKILICLAGGLALHANLRADDVALSDNPYAPVVERNIFGLNPPPPFTPAPPDESSLPKISPNGITDILGSLEVLFKVSSAGRPGQPSKEESYILSEGQRQDDIEVVKINEKDGTVTFKNHGTVQELPLVAATGGSAPAASGSPVNNFQPPPPMLNGAGNHFGNRGGANYGGNPGAQNYNGGYGNSGTTGGQNYGGINNGSLNTGGLNTGGLNFNNPSSGNSATFNAASQIPEGMTPEVQTIAIEANREATKEQVINGDLPPLPITELTPSDAVGAGGAPLVTPAPGSGTEGGK